tara:strand:- start:255 stop:368 length:114 start_codon:yes stop_codon:yes gene_type:complete
LILPTFSESIKITVNSAAQDVANIPINEILFSAESNA